MEGYGSNFADLMDSMFGATAGERSAPKRATDTRSRQVRREECRVSGHRYQVHGKTNPSKVACSRCEVSWGIGPRTEPS